MLRLKAANLYKELTVTHRELVDEICDNAKAWGWSQDMGTGRQPDRDEKDYLKSRIALMKWIDRVFWKCTARGMGCRKALLALNSLDLSFGRAQEPQVTDRIEEAKALLNRIK